MADQEGGRWDVGIKDNAVYLARVSDSDERLLQDQLAPEEARHLAELLNKYAGKVDDSARGTADAEDSKEDDEDSKEDDDGEDSKEDDDGEDDEDDGDDDRRDSSD